MHINSVIHHLAALAHELDPVSGEHTPREKILNTPICLEAINTAVELLKPYASRGGPSPLEIKVARIKQSNPPKRWEDDEDNKLKKLYAASSDITAIARQLNRSPSAVYNRLVRLGLVDESEMLAPTAVD